MNIEVSFKPNEVELIEEYDALIDKSVNQTDADRDRLIVLSQMIALSATNKVILEKMMIGVKNGQ